MAVFFAFIITLFKYLDTFIHELGHYFAGKLVGYEIERVLVGDRRQICSVEVFGTLFVFSFGFGGLTARGSSTKNSKLRLSIFTLGGVMLQAVVIGIIYILYGIGSEDNYFLPLIFMVINLRTIATNLYPRIHTQYGKQYPSDGLLLKMIIKAKA
jgi:hypothetical protein